MSTRNERAQFRRKSWKIEIKKMKEEMNDLVSLPPERSIALVERLRKESWYLQTGQKTDGRVDKTIVHIRKLGEACI